QTDSGVQRFHSQIPRRRWNSAGGSCATHTSCETGRGESDPHKKRRRAATRPFHVRLTPKHPRLRHERYRSKLQRQVPTRRSGDDVKTANREAWRAREPAVEGISLVRLAEPAVSDAEVRCSSHREAVELQPSPVASA